MDTRTTHRIDETGDEFCASEDEWMAVSEKLGWVTLGSWGEKGWDLGGSYVTFSWKQQPDGLWAACSSVEGDLNIIENATEAERDAWIDCGAAFHWVVGQSTGPCQCYVDEHGNPTPDYQNWSHRINLVRRALEEHCRSLGLDPTGWGYGWDVLSQHLGVHPCDPAMVEGWMLPEWRGPFSWARCDAAKEDLTS